MKQIRQGDVFLEKVSGIPKSATKAKSNLLVLGEGRDHGHFANGEGVEVLEAGGEKFVSVEHEAEIEHLLVSTGVWTKEHKPITIDKGYYKVIQQEEYNPYADTIEKVRD